MGRQQHTGQQQGGQQQGEQLGAEAAGGGHRGDGGEEQRVDGGEQPAQTQGEDFTVYDEGSGDIADCSIHHICCGHTPSHLQLHTQTCIKHALDIKPFI